LLCSSSSHSSYIVETLEVSTEMGMWNGHFTSRLALLSSVSNHIGQSVGVLHRGRHLDAPTHIVVIETKLVGELLYLIRALRVLNGVIHYVIVSWTHDTLSGRGTHQEKVISIIGYHAPINDSSWGRIRQTISFLLQEKPLAYSFVGQYYHQLCGKA